MSVLISNKKHINISYLLNYMLYNTNVTLTYKNFPDDETDTIYRKEMIKAFDLDTFDLDMINNKVETLYKRLVFDDTMKQRLQENAGRMLSNDLVMGFMICFSYDQFEETHEYICKSLKLSESILHL